MRDESNRTEPEMNKVDDQRMEQVEKVQVDYVEEELVHDSYPSAVYTPPPEKPIYRFAGFWMRLWAFLLDGIIIWSIGSILIVPLFRGLGLSTVQNSMFSPATIATTIVFYAYFILMTKYFKQTLGKMVFGLRVVDLAEERLSWKTVLFREGIGRYIAGVFAPITFIVYLVAAFTKKKQGVHDLFADTSVVHEN
ncbi:RDD family protein [Bacillus tianshenii]|uniref:RDD family protein n=1 Tax=Sutcliffiella tianshenii TaxID=1463404 RepID=UPI001CD7C4F3|nr:RDD family protein [Bacillus tianshenii]MCA1319875.1 RDD family protein [Bacillus tianshenii]